MKAVPGQPAFVCLVALVVVDLAFVAAHVGYRHDPGREMLAMSLLCAFAFDLLRRTGAARAVPLPAATATPP